MSSEVLNKYWHKDEESTFVFVLYPVIISLSKYMRRLFINPKTNDFSPRCPKIYSK